MRRFGRSDHQLGPVPGRGLHWDLLIRCAAPVAISQVPFPARLQFAPATSFKRRSRVVDALVPICEAKAALNSIRETVERWPLWLPLPKGEGCGEGERRERTRMRRGIEKSLACWNSLHFPA